MGEPHEVVRHELRGRDGALARGPYDRDLLLREDGQLVHHALGANLLSDADQEVGAHDAHEEHVAILPGEEHQDGEREVDGIEERQRMLRHDLADRLGLDVRVRVDEPP